MSSIRRIPYFFMLVALTALVACDLGPLLDPWNPRGPSPEPPRAPEDQRTRYLDQDGNDGWEGAATFSAAPGTAVALVGQLGKVDPDGVLDQVDYYRLQARHTGMLVMVEGSVEVDLVTADDQTTHSSSDRHLWFDALSLEGGYALRVHGKIEGPIDYTLRVAAGAHVRAPCEQGCRHGLSCEAGYCAQIGDVGAACLHSGDCLAGRCDGGRCAGGDEACTADAESRDCRTCEHDGDCAWGRCEYGICLHDDWTCEEDGAASGRRCRAGNAQRCVAGGWGNAGRCDTGCLGDACAPLPSSCDAEGAMLCLDDRTAWCEGGAWWSGYGDSGACAAGGGLEGAPCERNDQCLSPLRCMPSDLDPAVSSGVCAMPCDELGTSCHDGKTCSALLDAQLFCLDVNSGGYCDLDDLLGCPGAVAGACVDGSCWPSCQTSSCPGAGCACAGGIDCTPLDVSGPGATVGLCLNWAGIGETCGGESICGDEAVCVVEYEGASTGICRALCTSSCPDGQSCQPLTNNLSACFPY